MAPAAHLPSSVSTIKHICAFFIYAAEDPQMMHNVPPDCWDRAMIVSSAVSSIDLDKLISLL